MDKNRIKELLDKSYPDECEAKLAVDELRKANPDKTFKIFGCRDGTFDVMWV